MKTITFTVTTDLTYDQRMQRICRTLEENGFSVELVGRKKKNSIPLRKEQYSQKRISCLFEKGKLFYLEYNLRLFLYLLFKKTDTICAVDLDTLIGVFPLTHFKKFKLVHDAHEYFSELPELTNRPSVKRFWKRMEKRYYPQLTHAYTVSKGIANQFKERYHTSFEVIRNVPYLSSEPVPRPDEKYIVYSGALNKGRGLEALIRAVKTIDIKVYLCGKGDLERELQTLVSDLTLTDKVIFKGNLEPPQLKEVIEGAWLGYSVLEDEGLSYYYSLSNKFFDYIHAEIPQLAPDFPEYLAINTQWEVAELATADEETIRQKISHLLESNARYDQLKTNTRDAKKELNWEKESEKLIDFYRQLDQ